MSQTYDLSTYAYCLRKHTPYKYRGLNSKIESFSKELFSLFLNPYC